MLKQIQKFIPPRQLRLPIFGLLLIGVAVADQAKPVLSKQNKIERTDTYLVTPQATALLPGELETSAKTTAPVPDTQATAILPNQLKTKDTAPQLQTEELKTLLKSRKTVTQPLTEAILPNESQADPVAEAPVNLDTQSPTAPVAEAPVNLDTQSPTAPVAEAPVNLDTQSPNPVAEAPVNLDTQLETTPTITASVPKTQTTASNSAIAQTGKFPKQDGVYLYGQSPKPAQIGQGYIIFEKRQGKVMGALYMPNSEFSCFQGTLGSSGDLAMSVQGGPGEVGTTQVATTNASPKLSEDEASSYAYSVTLRDYYQLNSVSANDRQILQSCQANLQQ